ncbi:hypothetical protein SAM9427_37115 (plasmid) [Streptomyces sp. ETH9427]|uniref:hypothetical protein n=1 Tax=Streptomyces sp. E1N211 TaxID=1851876 RepID=UPI000E0AA326|nr:hypothetical protein [Streptomyces sp. E1N211]AXI91390.1 hypothetical protein SAM9427_37115 [Streptomyces sp. ETH9427]
MLTTLAPPVRVAAPSSSLRPVPVRFWEGDRMEPLEPRPGVTLRRELGPVWAPLLRPRQHSVPGVGDQDVRELIATGAGVVSSFVPRYVSPGETLPGRPVRGRDDMADLPAGAEGAVPFVSSRGLGGFWSLRDLVADRAGEEQAAGIPAMLPLWQMREALAVMLEEQEQVEVSWHRPSGRFYARYWAYAAGDDWAVAPGLEPRTHVYVLATSGVEG